MEYKKCLNSITKGIIVAITMHLILVAIFSMVLSSVDLNASVINISNVIIVFSSLVFATIVATKIQKEKGWLIGSIIGALFYIALYFIGILLGAGFTFDMQNILQLVAFIVVGMLSGILSINLIRQ